MDDKLWTIMGRLEINRSAGPTGIRGKGEIDAASLSPADRSALEELFQRKETIPPPSGMSVWVYTITRKTPSGIEKIDVPQDLVPAGLKAAVKEQYPWDK